MVDFLNAYISNSWLYVTLLLIYVFSILTIITVVVSENRSPVKSLAWVTVLVLFPLLGILLYAFFGRSIKNTRMISRRNRRRLRRLEAPKKIKLDRLDLTPESLQQIQLARVLGGAMYYPGNDFDVFTSGEKKFRRLLDDIAKAAQSINMQYYIISNDAIGQKVKDALIAAARRGVTVRVIYDHVGSFSTKGVFFQEMRAAGVQAYPFFRVAFPPFGTRINWRNHRKLCIIDDSIGYIGGMNVADRYIDGGHFDVWRDTHIRITGPAVGALLYSFAVDWNFMGQPLFSFDISQQLTNKPDYSKAGMQLLTSGPTSQWNNIAFLFVKAIGNAKKRVYIQTPYFLPTESLLRALQTAALSGVDVRIMMPRHSDSRMLDAASHSYMIECLQAGIKMYFYEKGMLHAKMMVVDDEFVTIGSTNFDFRSFEHNFEANMLIYSKAANAKLREAFQRDINDSRRVTIQEWKKRPLLKKAAESILRLLSPIL